jgi:hypothetical protein
MLTFFNPSGLEILTRLAPISQQNKYLVKSVNDLVASQLRALYITMETRGTPANIGGEGEEKYKTLQVSSPLNKHF